MIRNLVLSFVFIFTVVASTPVYAIDDCNGNATCAGDDQTITHNDNDTYTQQGGQGGAGGQGGEADADAKAFGLGLGYGEGGDADATIKDNVFKGGSADADADAKALALGVQGQQQGQVGINKSDVDVDTDVRTTTTDLNTNIQSGVNKSDVDVDTYVKGSEQDQSSYTSTKTATEQDQTAVGKVDSHDIFQPIEVDASTTTFEAPELPVNAAAAAIGGSCSQGLSFSTKDASGSIGTGNDVCDLLAVARGYASLGKLDKSVEVLDLALEAAQRRSLLAKVRGYLTLGLL